MYDILLFLQVNEVDVQEVGVSGAKNFFQAKADALKQSSAAEAEIKKEQEQRRLEREEKKERQNAFKERVSMFNK